MTDQPIDMGFLSLPADVQAECEQAATKRRDRAERVLILARCGHWWTEHRPDNLVVDHATPRVCTQCPPTAQAAVGVSPQGMAMVPVTYIDRWSEEQP